MNLRVRKCEPCGPLDPPLGINMEDGNDGKDTYNRKLKLKINDIANYAKYSMQCFIPLFLYNLNLLISITIYLVI